MRTELLEILRCPLDHGELLLEVDEEDDEGEVITGTLTCQQCSEEYPIADAIPRMLPPDLREELDARMAEAE